MSNIVELRRFDIHKDIRIVRDASNNRLGAVLEQLGSEGGDRFLLLLQDTLTKLKRNIQRMNWKCWQSCGGLNIFEIIYWDGIF